MQNPYNTGLDRNPANYQPLTLLTFLERAASVFPDHTAIVNGDLRRSYAEFYARSRQLASALTDNGIGRGDTVSVLLYNTPAMLECHYGVPMCGAVLHSINTRLDATIIAFQLDHAMAKLVIVDSELMPLMQEALADEAVTHLCGAPIVMSLLITAPDSVKCNLDQTVQFFTAAAPPPESVLAEMKEAGFDVTHLYGLTETYGPAVVND